MRIEPTTDPRGAACSSVDTRIDALQPRRYAVKPHKEAPMPRTCVFKFGNIQAIPIPAELAYADTDIDLEITRLGDVIAIFPACASMRDVVAALRAMPKPAYVEERQPIEVPYGGGTDGVAVCGLPHRVVV
jgi:antitoxin VapB